MAQASVPVADDDDEATLHERIKVAERALLVGTVGRMVREGWSVRGRKVRIGPCFMTQIPIRRALISVYDKTGLEELASGLHAAGVEIVSTGSTAARIAAAGVPVTPVEELTGFPECLDGRVKTLHPRVHAGLLADLASPAHEAQLAELAHRAVPAGRVEPVPVRGHGRLRRHAGECVEQIDIGGPSMVRAAAKNHRSVAVVTDPARYADVLAAVAGRLHPGPAPRAGGARRSRTPPPTTSRWRPGSRPPTRRTRPPARPAGPG